MKKQHYNVGDYHASTSVGYLLKRSHRLMHDIMEPAFAEQGFTFIQYLILAWLRDGIAVNAKDICSEMRHDSGALTRVIDQLAERGYLDRIRGNDDRRKVDLRLTDAGRRMIESLLPTIVERLNFALGDFTAEEVHELVRLLLKLNHTIQGSAKSGAGRVPADT